MKARNAGWLMLLGMLGCERGAPPRSPQSQPTPRATGAPALDPALRTAEATWTLTHRLLDGSPPVVVQQRRRCTFEWDRGGPRLVHADPALIRTGPDAPWSRPRAETVPAAAPAVGEGLLSAWLPNGRLVHGERWRREAQVIVAGRPLTVAHTAWVRQARDGPCVEMRAEGEQRWPSVDVRVRVTAQGTARFLTGDSLCPTHVEFRYQVLVAGGLGPDAESTVRYELTTEPRS